METVMTYAEYERLALDSFKSYKGIPPEYIEEVKRRNCIRRAYNEESEVTEFLGTNQLSPRSFAFGCHMLYPDFPNGDESKEEAEKPVFDFKFNGVHKK